MSGDWRKSCWVIWVRKIGMLKCLSAHKISAKTNWMSTKWINKEGAGQTAPCLLCYTTKPMPWNPRSTPRRADASWKFSLCWFLSSEMNGFQEGWKPSFWLCFTLFTINIRFHLYFNEKAILTSWQYGCASSKEPEISEAIWESWFTVLGATFRNSN